MKPACGPPKPSGTPKRWAEPTTTSAPSSPGGVSRVSASRSAATATIAPRSCAAGDQRRDVADPAGGARVGDEHAEEVAVGQPVGEVEHGELDAQRLGPGGAAPRGSAGGCRRRRGSGATSTFAGATRQRHRLGGGGAPRRAGSTPAIGRPVRSATTVWKVEQRLEPALADLGLVRRVGGVPGRVLEHVATDHGRRVRCRGSRGRSSSARRCCGRRGRAARRRPRPRTPAAGRASPSVQRIVSGTAASASASRDA